MCTLKYQSETVKLAKIHPVPGKRNRGREKFFSVKTLEITKKRKHETRICVS